MERQLHVIESALDKMKDNFEMCGAECDDAQVQYGAINAELKKTKKKCAKLEEEQIETEFALKTEIKLLLSKLATTNQKLDELNSQEESCSAFDLQEASTEVRDYVPLVGKSTTGRCGRRQRNRLHIDTGVEESPTAGEEDNEGVRLEKTVDAYERDLSDI